MEEKPKTQKELEREKLLLEIEELKKKWWKKPSYIAALFPTILALMTLFYGFANGYFQASFTKLENQKYDLQNQINAFEAEKNNLYTQLKQITEEKEENRKALEELNKNIDERKRLLEELTDTNPSEPTDTNPSEPIDKNIKPLKQK